MTLSLASFPISGKKLNPTQADYALEARLLRIEGAYHHQLFDYGTSAAMYRQAKAFDRVARRLNWSRTEGKEMVA